MATIPESYRSQLVRVADLPGWRSRRSARTNCLLVPSMKLSTVGGRAFPVAGPTIWNSLPDTVISAPSLSTFCQRLKTFLSCRPHSLTLSLIPGKLFPTSSGSWSDFITWTTVKICDWLIDWTSAMSPLCKMPSPVLVMVSIGSVGLGLGPSVSVRVSRHLIWNVCIGMCIY